MTKAAVVGTGFIGPVHAEALKRLGIGLRGILGSSPEKSKKAAQTLGAEKSYSSYEELLSDKEVSCVHLTTPNKKHFDEVKAALAAGKHVVCEKPLGMTSKETAELVRLAAASPKLITAVNYNIRFYPLALEARARVRRGDLGGLYHVRGGYIQDWLLFPTDFNWRVLAEEGGETRAIGDIGTHWLDLVQFVSGQAVSAVFADLKTVHPVRQRPLGSVETFQDKIAGAKQDRAPVNITTEDYGSVLLRFKSGAKGVVTVSQVTAGKKNSLSYEMAFAKGALAWDSESPNSLWLGSREKANESLIRDPSLLSSDVTPYTNYPGGHNEGFPDTFKQLYRAVYADIEKGARSAEPLYATFQDGHRELLLCEAILQSARSEKWVEIKD